MNSSIWDPGRIYDCLASGRKYQEMADRVIEICRDRAPAARTLLDVGCGTGRHLEHLQEHYSVTGIDPEPAMVRLAKRRVTRGDVTVGGFHNIGLSTKFDVICSLGGAIGYCHDLASLKEACENLAGQLSPGGLLIVEPWLEPTAFRSGRIVLDHYSDEDISIARMYVSECRGNQSIYDMKYLIGSDGAVIQHNDYHTLTLFTEAEYRTCLEKSGISLRDEPSGPFGYGLLVGTLVN